MQDVAADLDDCNIVIVGIGVIFFGGRICCFWCFVLAVRRRQSEGGSGYRHWQVWQGDVRGGGALGCWWWCSTTTTTSTRRRVAAAMIIILQLPLQLRKRDCTVQVFQTDDALVCHYSIFNFESRTRFRQGDGLKKA